MSTVRTFLIRVILSVILLHAGLAGVTLPVSRAIELTPTAAQATAASPGQLQPYRTGGHLLGFDVGGFTLTNGAYALRVGFVDAAPVAPVGAASASGADQAPPPLDRVTYPNLWPGITLAYDAPGDGLARSSYTVVPHADPTAIRLRYNAALSVERDGSLAVAYAAGRLHESAPVAWQEIAGERTPVAVRFALHGENEMGFALGAYDPAWPLVIDPTLSWHTFLGGVSWDQGGAIAVDSSGNIYVAGISSASWGAPVRSHSGSEDAFVAKLDAAGNLLWHTFLGGSATDLGRGIAVDGTGSVYVTGESWGTWGAPRRSFAGSNDAFVAKLDASGSLTWSTFLGGSVNDYGAGIAVDGNGTVFVAGTSGQAWGTPVLAHSGNWDAFVARLDTNGSLVWHTFMGSGSSPEYGKGIAINASGGAYVTGTGYVAWPTRAVQAFSGGEDAFVARVDGSGKLAWHTFLGGSSSDYGTGIATDGSGGVYVTGTSGAAWGTPLRSHAGAQDAFVARLDSSGGMTWHTFLGGSDADNGNGIAANGSGGVYVTGVSNAAWGAPLRNYAGGGDAFVAKLDSTGAFAWHTFLGGASWDRGAGIVSDGGANVIATGASGGGATWGAAPVRAYSGGGESFVVKVSCVGGGAIVLNANDSGCGSLRDALLNAAAGSTVTFDSSLAGQTITLANELALNRNITIDGSSLSSPVRISGNHVTRVFNVAAGAVVALKALDIVDGASGAGGGGIYNNGSLTVDRSTLSGHTAAEGGAILNANAGSLSIQASTLSGNTASSSGGAIFNSGSLTVQSSTLSGNSGGAVHQAGAAATTALRHNTVAGNSGSGLAASGGALLLRGSIIAGNSANFSVDPSASFTFEGYNLADAWNGLTPHPTDRTGDPLLAALAGYGGPTATRALLPGSPAIDAGDPVTCPVTDQRAITRPQGSACDSGAFESRGFTIVATGGASQRTLTDSAFPEALQVSVSSAYAEPVQGGQVTFTAPASGSSAIPASQSIAVGVDGTASANVSANSQVGVYVVEAGVSGNTGVAAFSLANRTPFATLVVDTTVDADDSGHRACDDAAPNDCSLRGAISVANADSLTGYTILVPAGVYQLTQAGSGEEANATGDLDVTTPAPLVISGASAGVTFLQAGSNATDGSDRVLHIHAAASVTLQQATVRWGRALGISLNSAGGGILNEGELAVTDAVVSQNTAIEGAGIFNDNDSTLTVQRSTLSANTATGNGGGTIIFNASAQIVNSTLSGNVAALGGGGIYNASPALVVSNSTLVANRAGVGNGGGIQNQGVLALRNTLIADSPVGGDCVNAGTISVNINNLVEDASCGAALSGDPLLASLAVYGGATPTHALLPNSPAIDAGAAAECAALAGGNSDQRGIARTAGTTCDIGAFESQGFGLSVGGGDNQSADGLTLFGLPLQVIVTSDAGEPVEGGQVIVTGPGAGAGIDPTSATASIGAGGLASQVVAANATVGSYAVTADAAGRSNSAPSFTLSNLPVNYNLQVDTTTDSAAVAYQACTNTADDDCSLRGAISKANANPTLSYTIEVPAGVYQLTIPGQCFPPAICPSFDPNDNLAGDLDIATSQPLTIAGAGADETIIQAGVTSYTEADDRVFHVLVGADLTLQGVTVRYGQALAGGGSAPAGFGGGILAEGSLTVRASTIADNFAGLGAGIASYYANRFSVQDSAVVRNSAMQAGGGIFDLGSPAAALEVVNTNLAENQANDGGGIYNQGGGLTVTGSVLEKNSAVGEGGGGIYNGFGALTLDHTVLSANMGSSGGGIYNDRGVVTLTGSELWGNYANQNGGGIFHDSLDRLFIVESLLSGNAAMQGGGGLYALGRWTMSDSRVFSNEAFNGAGIFSNAMDAFTVSGSTLMGNLARFDGGGLFVTGTGMANAVTSSTLSHNTADHDGGGIANGSELTLADSTLSGNSAGRRGGGIANAFGTLTLVNSTLSENSAISADPVLGTLGGGGGLYNDGMLNLANTLIANSPSGDDCAGMGMIMTNHNTLVEDGGCSAALSGDPGLGPLAENGGPTQTHMPQAGSAAIDAGDAATCAAAPISNADQRGVSRPQNGDGSGASACDIGAVEVEAPVNEAESVGGAGVIDFAATGVQIDVTDPGCLAGNSVTVSEPDGSHPDASDPLQTERYWDLTAGGCGSGFAADLTLPHDGLSDPTVCVPVGDGWDCGRDSFDATTVTRAGITHFSPWTVGNAAPPGQTPIVRGERSDSNVVLTWMHDLFNQGGYTVWRSSNPYFAPGDAGATYTPVDPVGSFTDTGAIGSGQATYYVVQGKTPTQILSGPSNPVGKFEFTLTPGG